MYAYDPFSLAMIRAMAGFSAGIYPAVLILYVYNLKRSIGKFSSFMPSAGRLEICWLVNSCNLGDIAVASLFFAFSFLIT